MTTTEPNLDTGVAQILEPLECQHERRDRRLRSLLRYAKEHSPWHARRLAGVDPDEVSGDDLGALPVMTKADLMTNWSDIVTDRAVRLEDALAHLEMLRQGEWGLLRDRYAVLATGGTTGSRGVFLMNTRFDPTVMTPDLEPYGGVNRFWDWQARVAPPAADDRPAVRAQIMSDTPYHISSVWRWLYGDGEFRHLRASTPIPELVAALNDMQPTSLNAYASVAHRLALEAGAGRLRIRPRSVCTVAEPLLPEARAAIETHFGVRVADEYGATEGYFAHWNPVNPGMHLVEDDAVYELVDADRRPVPIGQASSAMLLTNVWSYTLPLIRYEITDEVTLDPGPNPGPLPGRRVLQVRGRSDDWFRYGDVHVHPQTFRTPLGVHPSIAEYQVRQTATGADVVVVATGTLNERDVADELATALEGAGVVGAAVTVRRVAAIERHAETSKLRRFVPLELVGISP